MPIISPVEDGAPTPRPPNHEQPAFEHARPVPAEEVVRLAEGCGRAAAQLVAAAERLDEALEETARSERLEAAAVAEAVGELRGLLAGLAATQAQSVHGEQARALVCVVRPSSEAREV